MFAYLFIIRQEGKLWAEATALEASVAMARAWLEASRWCLAVETFAFYLRARPQDGRPRPPAHLLWGGARTTRTSWGEWGGGPAGEPARAWALRPDSLVQCQVSDFGQAL